MVSAARTIVDHDLLAELLAELGAEDARNRVGGAAGGLRDDEPDRLVRVLCRRAGGERARKQQQGHSKRAHVVPSHVCGCARWRESVHPRVNEIYLTRVAVTGKGKCELFSGAKFQYTHVSAF